MTVRRLELDEFDPDLAAMLGPKVARLGYLGEFFKCCATQAKPLRSFVAFTEDLKDALPADLTEIVALSVAVRMGNDYERNQHEHLCSKLGYSADWIADVERLDPARASSLSEMHRAAQSLAVAVVDRGGKHCAPELDAALMHFGDAATIAILMLTGRYATHAMIVNALDLAPPVPSIFTEQQA